MIYIVKGKTKHREDVEMGWVKGGKKKTTDKKV